MANSSRTITNLGRIAILPAFLLVLLAWLLTACGGGETDAPGEATEGQTPREVTEAELTAMVLSLTELGSVYSDYELDGRAFDPNEDEGETGFDAEDEAADVERFRRVNGYHARYLSPDGNGLVGTSVTLYKDGDGAASDLADTLEDFERNVNKTDEGVTLESAEVLDIPDIGDHSAGLKLRVTSEGTDFYYTSAGFQIGRLIGGATLIRDDDNDVLDEVLTIAGQLQDRMLAILDGEIEAGAGGSAPVGFKEGDIAYSACATDFELGTCRIFTMDANGKNRHMVAGREGWDALFPRWSPDGSHLLYTLCEPAETIEESTCREYLISEDGNTEIRLGNAANGVWSPDGDSIVVCAGGSLTLGCDGLVVMAPDGTVRNDLTEASDPHTTWSPDGAQLAFVDDQDGFWNLYVVNSDGSGRVKITDDQADDIYPAWSPNSDRIAFMSCEIDEDAPRGQRCNLVTIHPDGSGRARLTPADSLQGPEEPEWSPDGTRIALVFCPASDDPARISYIGYCDVHVVPLDGTPGTVATQVPYDDIEYRWLSWSPGSDRIVFSGEVEGDEIIPYDLFVVNADGSGLVNLTDDDDTADLYPDWRPGR